MNKLIKSILLACCLFCVLPLAAQSVEFTPAESFYPNWIALDKEDITWGYLTVPENWEKENGNSIKIAVARLKNKGQHEQAEAVVFLQGGPGAGGIDMLSSWLSHPLRQEKDIVLMDIRGTGFSEPRLCEDLGKEFMKILSSNQSAALDAQAKTKAALACKQNMIGRGIEPAAYHSGSIVRDLNALKSALGYKQWHVYGVSYGTYVAQVYAANYEEDIQSLLLDSAIDDISKYYTDNTSNYINSLAKVFAICANDPACNQEYPNLEKVYYQTIADLQEAPIKVPVRKFVLESEEFTYNAEDFKIAIQQALYNKQLVEVIPLLIYQFNKRNEKALGNLVAAFSSLLSLDYGLYYCVSCNEVLPNNDQQSFATNAQQFPKLMGPLSFYGSDFKVCEAWNENREPTEATFHDIEQLASKDFPVLVIAGEFDPITPEENGQRLAQQFVNGHLIEAHTYGHTPSFTSIGKKVATDFINNPKQTVDRKAFEKAAAVDLINRVELNAGMSRMGNSLNRFDLIFLGPLLLALILIIIFSVVYTFRIIMKKYPQLPDRIVRLLCILASLLGATCLIGLSLALTQVAGQNYFVLAFGLPEMYSYLFKGLLAFVIVSALTTFYYIFKFKKLTDRSVILSVIFSNIVLLVYFVYWDVF